MRAGSHRVEAVIDEMLQVLAHADLPHQLVLISIHAGQLPHMGKYILQSICQLQEKHPDLRSEPAPQPAQASPRLPTRAGLRPTWPHLEGIHIAQAILNMTVHNQLSQTKHFPTQMESIAKTRLFSFLKMPRTERTLMTDHTRRYATVPSKPRL